MKIAGLQKTTLIDYPGRVAATVFLAGCHGARGICR
jgi:pyruvate formate lyase activating enzyme